jgi:hypothetical protein
MVSGLPQHTTEQDQAELGELRAAPAMNGRTPAPPPARPMAPLPDHPALWASPERIAAVDAQDWTKVDEMPAPAGSVVLARSALVREQEQRAEMERRTAWSDLVKAEEAARHHRGVERMLRAEDRARDRRDLEDAERTRR